MTDDEWVAKAEQWAGDLRKHKGFAGGDLPTVTRDEKYEYAAMLFQAFAEKPWELQTDTGTTS